MDKLSIQCVMFFASKHMSTCAAYRIIVGNF